VLENVLRVHRSLRAYNCSDGARIAGALPKVARAVELAGPPLDRDALLAELTTSLHRYSAERLRDAWRNEDCRAQAREIFSGIENVLARAEADPDAGIDWIHEIFEIVRPDNQDKRAATAYLSGSWMIGIGCASWYDRRIADPDQRRAYRRIAIEVFGVMVADMRRRLDALFDDVEQRFAAA